MTVNDRGISSPDFPSGFLSSLSEHVTVLNTDGLIVASSESSETGPGFTGTDGSDHPSDPIGADYVSAIRTDLNENREPFLRGLRDVLSGREQEFNIDHSVSSPGGEKWFETRITNFEHAGRRFITVKSTDITERKLQQTRLEQNQNRLNRLISEAPTVIFSLETEPPFDTTWMCPNIGHVLGETAEAYENDPQLLWKKIPEDDRRKIKSTLEKIPAEVNKTVEHPWEGSDGKDWLRSNFRLIQDPQGNPVNIVGTATDITDRVETKQKLETTRRRFQELANHLEQVFWIVDVDYSSYEYLSPYFEELWGRPRDNFRSLPEDFLDTVHPEDRDRVREKLQQQKGQEYTLEYRIQQPDGTVRWIRDRAFPIRDETGDVVRISGISDDITERKRNEEKLKEQTDFLNAVNDSMPGVAYQFKVSPDGEFSFPYASKGFEDLAGVSAEAAMEDFENTLENVHPDDLEGLLESIEPKAENLEPWQHDFRILHPDGPTKWVRGSSLPETQDDGSVLFSGVLIDITDQKQLEQELEKKTARHELAQGLADLGHWSFTVPEREPTWSDETYYIFGLDPDETELTFEDIMGYYHPEDRERCLELLRQSIENNEKVTFEARITRPDGDIRHIDVYGLPRTHENGTVREMFGVIQDITDQKQREEELERSRELLHQTEKLANTGGWEVDVETGHQRWTDGTYYIHDLDPDDFDPTVENGIEFYHPEDQPEIERAVRRCMEDGESFGVKLRLITAEDRLRWVNATGQPVYENGKIVAVRGAIQDITKEQENQRKIKKQRNRFQSLFEESPMGLWEEDWSGAKTYLENLELPSSEDLKTHLNNNLDLIKEIVDQIEILLPNQRVVDMLSARDKDHLKENLRQLLTESSYHAVREELLDLWEGATSHTSENTIETFNGDQKEIRRDLQLVSGHEDDWSRVFVTYQDITDRKVAQQELRKNQRRLRQVTENIEDVFWLSDPDKNFIYVSPAFEDIWGIPAEDLYEDVGVFFEMIHPEDRDRVREAMFNDQATGDYDEEYRIIRPDGEQRWIHDRAFPVADDDLDEPRIAGIAEDITERKEREQELALKNRVVEEAPIGISILDPTWDDNPIVYVNEAFSDLTGYKEDELIGKSHKFLDGEKSDAETTNELRQIIENGDCGSVEIENYRKDGTTFWNHVTLAPVRDDDGTITHYVRFNQDTSDRKATEQELRESQQRFNQLAENISEIFWMFNEDFSQLLFINSSQYEEIWGRNAETLYEDPLDFLKGVHPEDQDKLRRAMEKTMEGMNQKIDIRVNSAEDFGRWVQIEGVPVLNDAGDVTRITGTINEITERKNTEEALRQSEERFRQLAENITEVFWITDVGKQEMIYVSPAYESVWGRSVESLYDKPQSFLDAIHPEDRERVEAELPNQVSGEYDVEYRVQQPDGEIRWVRDRAYPIENDDGEVYRIAGIAEDITRTKELQREREKFVELVENSPNYIARADLDSNLTYINQAGADMIGVADPEEAIGDSLEEIIADEEAGNVENVLSTIDDEGIWQGDRKILNRRTGEVTRVMMNAFMIHDPETGEPIRYAAVATDISDQLEVEEQLRNMIKEKETLLQEVHHRVKNNLQVILGLLGLQARKLDSEVASEALENSKLRIQSMAMIHQKLYEESHLSNINFPEYVKDLVEQIRATQIDPKIDPSSEVEVRTDVQISSLETDTVISCGLIINELVTNSLKHAFPEGTSGTVTVEFFTDESMDHHLVVSDDGQGISPDQLEEKESLGYELVRNLATQQLHGEVKREENDGLRIEVVFPSTSFRYE
ncbi:MAG: PAS domain-containing protein [bacterium]